MAKETTAAPVERSTKSISTSLPLNKYKALDDYHWTARKKLGEILTDAVDEYIVKHNIVVESEEAPAES